MTTLPSFRAMRQKTIAQFKEWLDLVDKASGGILEVVDIPMNLRATCLNLGNSNILAKEKPFANLLLKKYPKAFTRKVP